MKMDKTLKSITDTLRFLQFCKSCGRKHLMAQRSCPTCGVYETPQPVSDKVLDECHADYSCDGCIAYRDHTNPYG